MSETFERLWISIIDSDGFRRFTKYGSGSTILQSRAFQSLNMVRRYIATYYQGYKDPLLFHDVKTYCMFIGHNKSGTTLVGALLDAHPNVILADEADALQYVSSRFIRDQIFHLLLKSSRRDLVKGRVTARRLGGYSYLVPGQWQGRYNKIQAIGDSTSGSSTRRLAENPGLLNQIQEVMAGISIKFIQVIRNPFDPISLSMVRGKRTFENASYHYFTHCDTLTTLRKQIITSDLLAIRYEDFIHQPEDYLLQLCRFLGIEANNDYLEACTSILHNSPDRSRRIIEWDSKWINYVQDRIYQYDFLEGYTFDN